MNPWDVLAAALEDVLADDVNVYSTVTDEATAPFVLIRPDTPWITPAGASFPTDIEHYVAIAAVTASSPLDATPELHRMVHAIANAARAAGWQFGEVGAPALDESMAPYITAPVTLIYQNCDSEESI